MIFENLESVTVVSFEFYSSSLTSKSPTGLNAAVAVMVTVADAGVCGCGWLRFQALLSVLYDWYNV